MFDERFPFQRQTIFIFIGYNCFFNWVFRFRWHSGKFPIIKQSILQFIYYFPNIMLLTLAFSQYYVTSLIFTQLEIPLIQSYISLITKYETLSQKFIYKLSISARSASNSFSSNEHKDRRCTINPQRNRHDRTNNRRLRTRVYNWLF